MKGFFTLLVFALFVGCSEEKPKEQVKEFTPPADNKITQQMADAYLKASKYLMEGIKKQEAAVKQFTKRWNLSEDLSELSDSTYCDEHPEVLRAWERIQGQWSRIEEEAYTKAGISEGEFNWIGGALADTLNADVQNWIQVQLQLLGHE